MVSSWKLYIVPDYCDTIMIQIKSSGVSRLRCPIEKFQGDLFFSLVDYHNNMFTSDDPEKIIEFYNGFENRDQLIQWMKERPKGVDYIHEVEGDKDIIVVIPTADFSGKYAKECRENIFKGLHIIFVESGGRGDFYFNYAHNCNLGIKKAMEYDPKWVVLSNDDMDSNFSSDELKKALSNLNNEEINLVLTKEGIQSSSKMSVCSFTILDLLIYKFLNVMRQSPFLSKDLERFYETTKMNQEFGNRYFISGYGKSIFNIIRKRVYVYYNFEAFGIFSSNWLRVHSGLLDETYINAHEDQDGSIILSTEPSKIAWINYGISGIGGASLGSNSQRGLRTVVSDCYFNYKIENGLLGKII